MSTALKNRPPANRSKLPASAPSPPTPAKQRWHPRDLLRAMFSLDLRSLALMRIGLGLLILSDLIYRSYDMRAFYTEDGVMPMSALANRMSHHLYLTIHLLNGTLAAQVALFCIAGLFALALLAGYQTRLVTIVSWFLLTSLQNRNPLLHEGGDDVLRLLLFWGMFLPLGAVWSVDRALSKTPLRIPERFANIATAALILQICSIYWFTALLKTGHTWQKDNTAVYFALTIDQYAKPIARYLIPHHNLLKFLTFATVRLERFGPFIVLASCCYAPLRTGMVFAFMLFHCSLGTFLELGLFPHICVVAWSVFLPGWFWERLGKLWTWLPKPKITLPKNRLTERITAAFYRLKPPPISLRLHGSTQVVVGCFIVYIFIWNLRTANYKRYSAILPASTDWIAEVSAVEQNWGMFAPDPLDSHGWHLAIADLADGSQVELMQERSPVSWDKPPVISETYINDHWRRYLMNLDMADYEGHRLYYVKYLYRQWDKVFTGDRQIRKITMVYVRQFALPHYKFTPWERVPLITVDFATK